MKNNDLMIHSVIRFQESKQIDVTSIFESEYDRINIFYSNPNYYTQQKYLEMQRQFSANDTSEIWNTKTDDFFPYADFDNGYWTGYFVSRTGFKRLERVASSLLMAARQVESYRSPNAGVDGCKCMEPLFDLEDALGVAQHHDAISGTAKQHVANDYAKRVTAGVHKASSYMAKKIKELLLDKNAADTYLHDFGYCQLLNETICEISEDASRIGSDLYVVVYNALASVKSTIVGIPVTSPGIYSIQRVDNVNSKVKVSSSSVEKNGKYVVYFDTGLLPPTGAVAFLLSVPPDDVEGEVVSTMRELKRAHPSLSNNRLRVEFGDDGSFRMTDVNDGTNVDVIQRWGFYTSFDDKIDTPGTQNSGAYIFRPSEPDQNLTFIAAVRTEERKVPDLIDEVYISYEVPWIKEVMRLYKDSPYLEVEYTVGPTPIDDGRGKEIVTQYLTRIKSDGVFYTDSNGREFQKRVRSSRPSWNLTEHEPIAGNYYPVNAALYIEDETKSLGVVTDRSQGGSSLTDGCAEFMVQRRTLRDDQRGVAEPLNETDGDVTPYPPYGDATRYGEGVVISGKHRIVIGKGNAGASITRSLMDQAFSEPLVFVGSAEQGTDVPFLADSFALIKTPLPENVMLITFKYLPREPKVSYLVRLGHQYAADEDPELSKQVSVDLEALVGRKVVNCEEKTLSGNRALQRWQIERLDWRGLPTTAESQIEYSKLNCTVTLKPMQIRTFQLQVESDY